MKKFINTFEKITNKTCYGMSFLSMFAIVFMMFLMVLDVVLNLAINERILGAYELTQVGLVILVFSSWAYTQSVQGHIHVVMFINMMPKIARFVCFGLTSLISTVTMGVGAYAVWIAVEDRMKSKDITANLMIPYWPLFVIEALAFTLFTIVLLKDTIKAFWSLFDEEIAKEVQSHWV